MKFETDQKCEQEKTSGGHNELVRKLFFRFKVRERLYPGF